jgi:uncharacterized protein YggT (Ycf19 family)
LFIGLGLILLFVCVCEVCACFWLLFYRFCSLVCGNTQDTYCAFFLDTCSWIEQVGVFLREIIKKSKGIDERQIVVKLIIRIELEVRRKKRVLLHYHHALE